MVGSDKDQRSSSFGAWSIEKRAKLTRNIALLATGLCLFYMIFDFFYGAYSYIPYYLVLFVGGTLCLILLKYKVYTWAKTSLLLSGLVILGIFASWETRETGIFMYFLVVALASITLFGTEEKWTAVVIGLLTFSVFYVVYFTNVLQFEQLDLSEEYIENSLLINYSVCLIATITMVYYILSISNRYEQRMHETQQNLIELTEDLATSRNRFELAIKGSSAGIWDWDAKKDEIYVSPLLASTLGFKLQDLQYISSDKAMDRIHPDDREHFTTVVREHLKEKKSFRLECRIKKADGTYLWTLESGQAQWDAHGNVVRMVGSLIDIQERKIVEQEVKLKNQMLQKTNEELDRFVYSTSHDLRAPLSSMLGLINIAQISSDPKEVGHCVDMMQSRVETLNGFIKDIIDYSRNSRLELSEERFQFKDLIDQVLSGLEYYNQIKAIRFDLNFSESLSVSADQGRLKIILNNLITNAIKYHDLEGEPSVEVTALLEDEWLHISVIDNGPGIDTTEHDKIFNMFYRASEKSDGSGLGLYIAKEMTDKLNGKLSLRKIEGRGSHFDLSIPIGS